MRRVFNSWVGFVPSPSLARSGGPAGARSRLVSAWLRRGRQGMGWSILRSLISAGFMGAILAGCLTLPNIDHATVALLMVAATGGLAMVWGWPLLGEELSMAAIFTIAVVLGAVVVGRNAVVHTPRAVTPPVADATIA